MAEFQGASLHARSAAVVAGGKYREPFGWQVNLNKKKLFPLASLNNQYFK